jgi:hypothetical protein
LGNHTIRCFDDQGQYIQPVDVEIKKIGQSPPIQVQLDKDGNLKRNVRFSTFRITGSGIAGVEIRGHIALYSLRPYYDKETRLVAPNYRNGDIDWYTFTSGPDGAQGPWLAPTDSTLNPIVTTPTRIEVGGASPRWWAFEDGNTNFGAMDVAKPDLAKLLLMEFALVYGDDWFSVPAPVPIGSLARVDELKVWNVFGEVTDVGPARQVYPADESWADYEHVDDRPDDADAYSNDERFDLFTLSGTTPDSPGLDVRRKRYTYPKPARQVSSPPFISKRRKRIDHGLRDAVFASADVKSNLPQLHEITPPRPILLIPPVTGYRQESAILEEVYFLRDEGANMMWAVEKTVREGCGQRNPGFEAQQDRYIRRRDPLHALLAKLKWHLEYSSPSEDQSLILEIAISDLQSHIADLSPDARPTPSQDAVLRYRLATTVPENWIPFIPTRRNAPFGARHEAIQFRRARMLRNVDHRRLDDTNEEMKLTMTLRQFLDLHQQLEKGQLRDLSEIVGQLVDYLTIESDSLAPDDSIPAMSKLLALDNEPLLFVKEETVPRSGLRLQLTKQRARWVDGSTHVWLGRKVLTGRGEGDSGLKFDSGF